jgi:hypothetical protein
MAGEDDTAEAINREQQDKEQAQDVAEDARHPGRGLGESRRAPGDRTQIIPDDVPDLVDTMSAMVSSGRIDNGAFAGEPQHDDEEDMLGKTDSDDDEDGLFNELADGSEDPLAVPIALPDLSGDGPKDEDEDEDDEDEEDEEDEADPDPDWDRDESGDRVNPAP